MPRRHALQRGGAGFTASGCATAPCTSKLPYWREEAHAWVGTATYGIGGPGHGRCNCGATSPHLKTSTARKAWYRKHLKEVA